MTETRYRYPGYLKIKIAWYLLLDVWFLGTGLYFAATRPPASLNARLGLAAFLLILAVSAANLSQLLNTLRSEISVAEAGIYLRRGDQEVTSVAWPELGEIRGKSRWGDFEIRSIDATKVIRVHRRLIGLDELRQTLSDRLSARA